MIHEYWRGFATALLVTGLASGAVQAQTLTQRQTMTHEDAQLTEQAQTASQICGTTITAAFDWHSFVAADKIEDMNGAFHNPPSNMCTVPLQALQSMCQDAQAKQAIAAKIKSFNCAYQDGAATQSMSLDPAGKLTLQSSYEAYHNAPGTPSDFVKDWLGKHL